MEVEHPLPGIHVPIHVPRPAEGQDFEGMAWQLHMEMEGLTQTLTEQLAGVGNEETAMDFNAYLEAAELVVEMLAGRDPAGPPSGSGGPFMQLVTLGDLWNQELMMPDNTMDRICVERALEAAGEAVRAIMTWAFGACERMRGAALEERLRGIRSPEPRSTGSGVGNAESLPEPSQPPRSYQAP